MRSFVLLLVLVSIAVAAMLFIRPTETAATDVDEVTATRTALLRIQQRVTVESTFRASSQRDRGFPESIDPAWFSGDLPRSPWFDETRPWIEVAPSDDAERLHPTSIMPTEGHEGAFWYNPANGVIRARVPAGISDQATIDRYNAVNDAELTTLFP